MIAVTQLDLDHFEVVVDTGAEGQAATGVVRLTDATWRALTARRVTPEALIMETVRYLRAAGTDARMVVTMYCERLAAQDAAWRAHVDAWLARGR